MLRSLSALVLTLTSALAFAQDSKYGATVEEQTACKEALSVYRSYRDQNNNVDALVHWRKACSVCPEKVEESIYLDGVKFFKAELVATEEILAAKRTEEIAYSSLLDKSAEKVAQLNSEIKSLELSRISLQDSILALYDKRIALYPATKSKPKNGCSVLERKVSDYLKFRPQDVAGANAMLRECITCLEAESSASTLNAFYQTAFRMLKGLQGEPFKAALDQVLTDYLWVMEIAGRGLANAKAAGESKDIEAFTKAMANIDEVFITLANCDDMVPVLEKKLQAAPDDLELKKKVLSLLMKKECMGNAIYLPLAEAVHAATPTAATAYGLGIDYAKKDNVQKALAFFEQAVELCPTCEQRESYLTKAAQVSVKADRTSAAKKYALELLRLNSSSAEAYEVLGDVVYANAGNCNDGNLGKRAAYWFAADYFSRAKGFAGDNSNLQERLSGKLSNCARQYPSIEEIFNVGIAAGSSFTMPSIGGCPCSGETTTVRVR
jgi:tetratricopeptide (TPR) repeat protein